MKTKHLHILLTDKEYDRLKEKSYKEKKSLGQVVRELLEKAMSTSTKK